jgi:DNA polymerase-4
VFVPPDFTRYRAASQLVRAIFARHTDLIEPLSLDEAYLDVTENKTGLPSATAVAERIRAEIFSETQLTASAGIAPSKFLAKIASDWRKPNGQFVIRPGDVEAFLTELPVAVVPGVGKVMAGKLEALGIRLVGDLRTHGRTALEQRFGRWGARLHELSLGIDERRVEPNQPTQSISSEDTFAVDLLLSELEPAIRELAERTWRSAGKESQRIGRSVVLKLKTADFRLLTRTRTPHEPPTSAQQLIDIALGLRDRVGVEPTMRYRLVGVGLANFMDRWEAQAQGGLFGED